MSLTKCPDCSSEVSSDAPTCPKCGHPIAAHTIELTSKKWKKMTLAAYACVIVGFYLIFQDNSSSDRFMWVSILSTLLIFTGIVMWVVAKFGTWWHNK